MQVPKVESRLHWIKCTYYFGLGLDRNETIVQSLSPRGLSKSTVRRDVEVTCWPDNGFYFFFVLHVFGVEWNLPFPRECLKCLAT